MSTFLSKKLIFAALVATCIFHAPSTIDASQSPRTKAYEKRRKRKQHNYRSPSSTAELRDKCLENGEKAFRNLKAHGAPFALLMKLGFILAVLTSVSSAADLEQTNKICPNTYKVNGTYILDETHLAGLNAQFMRFNNHIEKLPDNDCDNLSKDMKNLDLDKDKSTDQTPDEDDINLPQSRFAAFTNCINQVYEGTKYFFVCIFSSECRQGYWEALQGLLG